MKKKLTGHLFMRMVSLIFIILSFLFYFVFRFPSSGELALVILLSADIMLLLYPLPSHSTGASLIWAGGYCLFVTLASLFRVPAAVLCPLCCAFMTVYLVFRLRQRFRKAKLLFCSNNVMLFIRDCSHLFYAFAVVLTVSFIPVLWPVAGGCWEMVALCLIFVALYYRSYSVRTLFVSATFEREVFEISRGEVRNIATGNLVNDSRMEAIYSRIVEYMEKEKPYLDSSYSIYDMAQQAGTNKTYISRVINIYSGRNFCQFINWYRVRYAASYANDNPDVKVTELALRSGFNSNVSFNSAFKVFMGYSPGEYLQQIARME